MQFLGTGAAEMYPNPYCDCDVCEGARKAGAIPRLRSAFMIDEHNLIDFGLDVLAASSLYHVPLSKVDNVFITHTHVDHFSIGNISAMAMADKRRGHYPMHFYLSEDAYNWVLKLLDAVRPLYNGDFEMDKLLSAGRLEFHPVKPYVHFEAGNMKVFAVQSNHRVNRNEWALNFLLDHGNEGKLLYALDTGFYSDRNLEALRGANADYLIMEGTFGSLSLKMDSAHMNAEHFVEQVENFAKASIIKPDAKIYVTHINQCNTFSHEEYQSYVNSHSDFNITVGYDGMII